MIENAILIAGPTASGKSRLALDIAGKTGGAIVNADSMQVYSILRVLTARPGEEELSRTPHLLYGHVHPSEHYSTGRWLREVEELASQGAFAASRPIFVGGTGLYFKSLLEGLSPMPRIPARIREKWRQGLEAEGPEALHGILRERDAEAAEGLRSTDGQRIVRALEVVEASGRSILSWQAERGRPLVDAGSADLLLLQPDRAELVIRIESRFDAMVAAGALEEVRRILELDLDPSMPAMKAIGVPELAGSIQGSESVDSAIARAKAATRRYAKRQTTWFRTQFGSEWRRIGPGESGDMQGLELSD